MAVSNFEKFSVRESGMHTYLARVMSKDEHVEILQF